MAIATSALSEAFGLIHAHEPRAKLGGIVGDVHHSFGYHLARNELGPGDYSVILPLDKKGPSDTASALDVTLPDDLMRTMTARLHDAALAHDYRLRGLREFCGTIDGEHTFPWDLSDNSSEGLDTWDDSHLWHIHLSGYRAYVNDKAVWADIAAVLLGEKATNPHPAAPYLHRRWPAFMGPNDYFGLITGPDESHGGAVPMERPFVRAIQMRLVHLGYLRNPIPGNFGAGTYKAVARWQHAKRPGTTRYGEVWRDDWQALFWW
jgi:hypothetical protein